MSTFHDAYVGVGGESQYGVAAPPAAFTEFVSESFAGKYERIDSEGLRAGQVVARTDRFAINPKGAEGDLKIEVIDNALEGVLGQMLGSISTAAPTGGFQVSTVTLGDLKGKSATYQVGRVDSNGTMRHFAYSGGKIKSWELSNSVDQILALTLSLDFAGVNNAATSAAPTYSTAPSQVFTFVGGAVTIAGSQFAVNDVSIKGDNGLKVDRYALRGAQSTTKREPLTEGMKALTFELKGEFEDMSHVNRVASATAAGSLAALTCSWDTPQGGNLTVSMPFARFDTSGFNVDGAKILDLSLSGIAMTDGAGQPITITYKGVSAS